ncbi:MAG TPA: hypothetical protein VLK25_03315 [Allosphingosinicella sp.]|nr:hypothetical protein [Allosphingosinicella sp.]
MALPPGNARGRPMPDYRLYSLDPHSGHIDGVEEFHAPSDDAAIDRVQARAGRVPLELWQEGRKLLRVTAVPDMAAAVPVGEAEPVTGG